MNYAKDSHKQNSTYRSVNELIKPKKHRGLSAFPPYATEEQIKQVLETGRPLSAFPPYATEEQKRQVLATGRPLSAMPPQNTFSNLKISKPDDPAELEADGVAEQVVHTHTIDSSIHHAGINPVIQTKSIVLSSEKEILPSKEEELKKEEGSESKKEPKQLQRKTMAVVASGTDSAGNSDLGSKISTLNGKGSPLPDNTRAFFENGFNHNFENVRVHTDLQSQELARSINARAFTVGENVVFAKGEYAPEAHEGQKLLAHELTHVVQQGDQELSIQREEKNKNVSNDAEYDQENKSNQIEEKGQSKKELLEHYKTNARKLLQFKLDTIYYWIDKVVRVQVINEEGQGSKEAATTLREAGEYANKLGKKVWYQKQLVDAYQDLIKYHVPLEGHPLPEIAGISTTESIKYIQDVFNKKNLNQMGYPKEIPDITSILDTLGMPPAVTEEEIDAYITKTATDQELLEYGYKELQEERKLKWWGSYVDPPYEWTGRKYAEKEIREIGAMYITKDPGKRDYARLVLESNPGRKGDPAEISVLDQFSVKPAYNYNALRLVINRLQNEAITKWNTSKDELEIHLDHYPLLRMYISNIAILNNDVIGTTKYIDFIKVDEIEPGNLLEKIEKLLKDITKIKQEVASDEDFLFDSAIAKQLEPLITAYRNIDPTYAEWILQKFEDNKRWQEIINTLLYATAVIGFGLGEVLSGGWASVALAGGASAMAGMAVRSQMRSSLLSSTMHIGFSEREEVAVAEFTAWFDTAMAALGTLQTMVRINKLFFIKAKPNISVDIRKFSEYIFKDGVAPGKIVVFKNLGYELKDSELLTRIYKEQAAIKYVKGDYTLGIADSFGQRINIEIELHGVRDAAGKISYIKSGWMIRPDGRLTLNTPFSGFTK